MSLNFTTLAATIASQLDNISEDKITINPEPIKSREPNIEDLDALLAESMALRQSDSLLVGCKKLRAFNTSQKEVKELPKFVLQLQEGIEVWEELICECGESKELYFLRYMEKYVWKEGKDKVKNWRTVENLDERLKVEDIKQALIKRTVKGCRACKTARTSMEDFNAIIK